MAQDEEERNNTQSEPIGSTLSMFSDNNGGCGCLSSISVLLIIAAIFAWYLG